jgi:hypothetical protein
MKILHLRVGSIADQAGWWVNFIKDCDERGGWDTYSRDSERVDFIINEVRKAGAEPILRSSNVPGSIIGMTFENEAKANWFLLRWS